MPKVSGGKWVGGMVVGPAAEQRDEGRSEGRWLLKGRASWKVMDPEGKAKEKRLKGAPKGDPVSR